MEDSTATRYRSMHLDSLYVCSEHEGKLYGDRHPVSDPRAACGVDGCHAKACVLVLDPHRLVE